MSDTIKKVGVWTDNLEPCIYQGSVSLRGKVLGLVCLVVYVDDILLGSSCLDAEQVVVDAISSVRSCHALSRRGRISHIYRENHLKEAW